MKQYIFVPQRNVTEGLGPMLTHCRWYWIVTQSDIHLSRQSIYLGHAGLQLQSRALIEGGRGLSGSMDRSVSYNNHNCGPLLERYYRVVSAWILDQLLL